MNDFAQNLMEAGHGWWSSRLPRERQLLGLLALCAGVSIFLLLALWPAQEFAAQALRTHRAAIAQQIEIADLAGQMHARASAKQTATPRAGTVLDAVSAAAQSLDVGITRLAPQGARSALLSVDAMDGADVGPLLAALEGAGGLNVRAANVQRTTGNRVSLTATVEAR